jgi:hemolysin D
MEGVVERLSPDAVSDERLGLVFPARVRLTKTSLRGAASRSASERRPDVARTVLSPGMSAQVEIVTGRRRVIEYLLSPIARAVGEAGRER